MIAGLEPPMGMSRPKTRRIEVLPVKEEQGGKKLLDMLEEGEKWRGAKGEREREGARDGKKARGSEKVRDKKRETERKREKRKDKEKKEQEGRKRGLSRREER